MAYSHFTMSVQMMSYSASTANTIVAPTTSARVGGPAAHGFNVTIGDNWGCAAWSAGLQGYKVHAYGIETNTNFTDGVPIYLRRRIGSATCPEASLMTMTAPTTTATGPIAYKYATQNIIVTPGTKVIIQVTTVVADIRANSYLLVSPVPESLINASGGAVTA